MDTTSNGKPAKLEPLGEAVRLGQNLGQPVTTEPLHYAVIPEGSKIVSLEEYQFSERPRRRAAAVVMADVPSFIAYYRLFEQASQSRVFADPATASFLGVLDYHGIGDMAPAACAHTVKHVLRQSDQWLTWKGKNGFNAKMSQAEFAEFIEENAVDIVSPSSAFMLEVSRDIKARQEVNFGSATVLSNGQVALKFEETIRGTVGVGEVEIPQSFQISIPVFYGESPQVFTALLRYRISSGHVVFWYDLQRFRLVLEEAFRTAVSEVATAIGQEVLIGTNK